MKKIALVLIVLFAIFLSACNTDQGVDPGVYDDLDRRYNTLRVEHDVIRAELDTLQIEYDDLRDRHVAFVNLIVG